MWSVFLSCLWPSVRVQGGNTTAITEGRALNPTTLVTACLDLLDAGKTGRRSILRLNSSLYLHIESPHKFVSFRNVPRCETDVDECVSEPCMNGGVCVNHVNSFQCVCDLNHSGVHCQVDVSDFYVYLFLGVWQSLFQAVSYLLIRPDDEPEIDWVFHIND